MASNLTNQVREIAAVTTAVARGDLSKMIKIDARGEIAQLKEEVNTMVESLRTFSSEVIRLAREVGTEGKLGAQAKVPGVAGVWADLQETVNVMASNLTMQVRTIAKATEAVAQGRLDQQITGVPFQGEMKDLSDTINSMIRKLALFSGEVKRVATQVGVEGKLGVQAEVDDIQGEWRSITVSTSSFLLTGIITDPRTRTGKRQRHGYQLDLSSASIRPDQRRCNGRRLHQVHHGRGKRRDEFPEE